MALDLDLVERRIQSGQPVAVIAVDLGVTARTIRNHLHRAGRPLARQLQHDQRRKRLSDAKWLRSRFVNDQQPACEIAAELHTTTDEVNAALLSLEIVRPPRRPGLTQEALVAAFAAGETVSSIARRERIDRHGVRRAMRHNGVGNPHPAAQPRPAMLDDPVWLSGRYEDCGWSLASIARECGSSGGTLKRSLQRHGIAPSATR